MAPTASTHGEVGQVVGLLGDDAHPRAPVRSRLRRVDAENPHRPVVIGPEAATDLDGGGLARPVRPEQGEDLAAPHVQVEVAHRWRTRYDLRRPCTSITAVSTIPHLLPVGSSVSGLALPTPGPDVMVLP
jgi:hypothetical protein